MSLMLNTHKILAPKKLDLLTIYMTDFIALARTYHLDMSRVSVFSYAPFYYIKKKLKRKL